MDDRSGLCYVGMFHICNAPSNFVFHIAERASVINRIWGNQCIFDAGIGIVETISGPQSVFFPQEGFKVIVFDGLCDLLPGDAPYFFPQRDVFHKLFH